MSFICQCCGKTFGVFGLVKTTIDEKLVKERTATEV